MKIILNIISIKMEPPPSHFFFLNAIIARHNVWKIILNIISIKMEPPPSHFFFFWGGGGGGRVVKTKYMLLLGWGESFLLLVIL